MKLLLATSNEGKIREYRILLQGEPFEIVTPLDFAILEKPEETGSTLDENASLKARFYGERAQVPVLADDTGLEIDALGGEPGIHARRWPGYEATDEELVSFALQRMEGISPEKRTARFRTVIAIASLRGEVRTFSGSMEGQITEKAYPPLISGLPYRSIFYYPKAGKVLSQLAEEEFDHGHRAEAISKGIGYLRSLAS